MSDDEDMPTSGRRRASEAAGGVEHSRIEGKGSLFGEMKKYNVLDLHGYKVGRAVGKGSYATVREAFSQKHRCKVAVKVISKKRAPRDYVEKFLPREIEVIKILRHSCLVLFMQCIETTNRVYLIMEYSPNGDLLEAVRSRKFVQEPLAGLWFSQMCEGIEYCHSVGVVHRDLKCENILLDRNENIKVTDFGFARGDCKPSGGALPPLCETYCGSYAYAPPEILTGTPYVGQYADIWSLGVILYVMVLGRLPFDDSNHRELLKQVRRGPNFPDKRPISKECKILITKILVKCEDRPGFPSIKQNAWFRKHRSGPQQDAQKDLAPRRPSEPLEKPTGAGTARPRAHSVAVGEGTGGRESKTKPAGKNSQQAKRAETTGRRASKNTKYTKTPKEDQDESSAFYSAASCL